MFVSVCVQPELFGAASLLERYYSMHRPPPPPQTTPGCLKTFRMELIVLLLLRLGPAPRHGKTVLVPVVLISLLDPARPQVPLKQVQLVPSPLANRDPSAIVCSVILRLA